MGYEIGLYKEKNDSDCIISFNTDKTNLLQAYWQVACEIAEEIINKED